MLVISSRQLEMYKPLAENALADRIVKHLRENHGTVTVRMTDEAGKISELPLKLMQRLVANGIARARRRNIEWKSTTISFVTLMFLVAPNFDEYSSVDRWLSSAEIITDSHFETLMRETTDGEWEAMIDNYDPQSWFARVEVKNV